jgi:hypothetical protein
MSIIFTSNEREYSDYSQRCDLRQKTIYISTMNFVDYFIALGDDKPTADSKVSELSTEVATYLYAYVLGNISPLIDSINSSTLPFMDSAAKTFLITSLTTI